MSFDEFGRRKQPQREKITVQRDTLIHNNGKGLYELCGDWDITYPEIKRELARLLEKHPEYADDPNYVVRAPERYDPSLREIYLHPAVYTEIYKQLQEKKGRYETELTEAGYKSYDEAAEILAVSKSTVYNITRKLLRQIPREEHEQYLRHAPSDKGKLKHFLSPEFISIIKEDYLAQTIASEGNKHVDEITPEVPDSELIKKGNELQKIGGKTIFEVANLLGIPYYLAAEDINAAIEQLGDSVPEAGKIQKSEDDTGTYVTIYHPDIITEAIAHRTQLREAHYEAIKPKTPLEYKRAIINFFDGEDQDTVKLLLDSYLHGMDYHPEGDAAHPISIDTIYTNLQQSQITHSETNVIRDLRQKTAPTPLRFLHFLNEIQKNESDKIDLTQFEKTPDPETKEERRLRYLPEILSYFPTEKQGTIKALLVDDGCLQGGIISPLHTTKISDTLVPNAGTTVIQFIRTLEKRLSEESEQYRSDPEMNRGTSSAVQLSPELIIAWLTGNLTEVAPTSQTASVLDQETVMALHPTVEETTTEYPFGDGLQMNQPLYDTLARLDNTYIMREVAKIAYAAELQPQEVEQRLDLLVDFFEMSEEQLQTMLRYYPHMIMNSKKELKKEVKQHAKFLGISKNKLKERATQLPFFIGTSMEDLHRKEHSIQDLFLEFGIQTDESTIHKKAQTYPLLLMYKVETIRVKISDIASTFTTEATVSAKMIFSDPRIIAMTPERLERSIEAVMYIYEIDREKALERARNHPTILHTALYSDKFKNRTKT